MLAYYRNRVGMTPEQLGARVYLSGSQIRKVEAGTRTPSEDLAKACEAIPELGCNGALTELYEILGEHLKRRAYPGWFAGWPDKEAQARRLRWFEPLVVPGLLQTEAYARSILSTRMGATPEELDEAGGLGRRLPGHHAGLHSAPPASLHRRQAQLYQLLARPYSFRHLALL